MMKSLLVKSVVIGMLSVSLADTQESTSASRYAFMQARFKQYEAADRVGTNAYHSDRDVDIAKFLRPSNRELSASEKVIESDKSNFLSAVPIPSASASMRDIIKTAPNNIVGGSFDVAGFIPVWTGEKWADGMPLALNGFDVSEKHGAFQQLHRLNWMERTYGNYFCVEVEEKEMKIVLGPSPLVKLYAARFWMEMAGYEIKFDKTFYIWRIVETNAPPEIQGVQ